MSFIIDCQLFSNFLSLQITHSLQFPNPLRNLVLQPILNFLISHAHSLEMFLSVFYFLHDCLEKVL